MTFHCGNHKLTSVFTRFSRKYKNLFLFLNIDLLVDCRERQMCQRFEKQDKKNLQFIGRNAETLWLSDAICVIAQTEIDTISTI